MNRLQASERVGKGQGARDIVYTVSASERVRSGEGGEGIIEAKLWQRRRGWGTARVQRRAVPCRGKTRRERERERDQISPVLLLLLRVWCVDMTSQQ